MGNISFGKDARKLPNPSGISNAIDIYSAGAGVIIAWSATSPIVPHNVSDIMASILGLGILLCQALKPYFGVKTNQTSVPIDQVAEIEEPKKD